MKNYTQEQLEEAVKACTSVAQVLQKLGYKVSGGNVWKRIKKEIEGLDTSHFDSGRGKLKLYTLDEILVENSLYKSIYQLKKRLVSEGKLDYECVECGNKGKWEGKPLSLQLDHINGIRDDHRLENLRFLCPNCHSQTDTFAGRNSKKG